MSSNLEDVEFVLQEVQRFGALNLRELKGTEKLEVLSTLPHPAGHGILPCGSAAIRRLRAMGVRAVEASRYKGRIDAEVILNELRRGVVHRFLKEGRPLVRREADRLASWALRTAAKSISDRTHLTPCNIAYQESPGEVRLGPVTFVRREARWPKIEQMLSEYIALESNSPANEERDRSDSVRESLARQATNYYGMFSWIAEVKVAGCDPATSRLQSKRLVSSALGCLQLLVGARRAYRMRVGGIGSTTDNRVHLSYANQANLEVSGRYQGRQNSLGDGWFEDVLVRGGAPVIRLLGLAIEHGNQIPEPMPLSRKFLDAVHWYSDAIADENIAAKLVKYVTAMEHILLAASQQNDIAETIGRRGAAFAYRGSRPIGAIKSDIKKVYSLRSRLVHGTLAPASPEVALGIGEAAILTELILLGVLFQYGEGGLVREHVSVERINKNYDEITSWAEEVSRRQFQTLQR